MKTELDYVSEELEAAQVRIAELEAKIARVESELAFMRELVDDDGNTVNFRDGANECVVRIEKALRGEE